MDSVTEMLLGKPLFECAAPPQSGHIALSDDQPLYDEPSLRWDWQADGALTFTHPFRLSWRFRDDGVVYAPVFHLNVYCEVPIDGQLRIEVGEALFTFNLNYTGWRAATVRYYGDMQGRPHQEAPGFRIVPPADGQGTLWLACIVPNAVVYEALPMADAQVPYLADGIEEHRDPGAHREHMRCIELGPPTCAPLPDTNAIIERIDRRLLSDAVDEADEALRKLADINPGPKGRTIRHVISVRGLLEADCYVAFGDAARLLRQLADAFRLTGREDCRKGFLALSRHMIDQGWVARSAFGTVHLIGYSMAPYCSANFMMREVLAEAGLADTVAETACWLTNAKECALSPPFNCCMDWLHTQSESQLMALMMAPDLRERSGWMQAFARHVDASIRLQTDDERGGFKWDGAAFHHYGHYPAYAAGAVLAAARLRALLADTVFALSDAALDTVRHSIRVMLSSAMNDDLPMSVSGRHPFLQPRWVTQIRRAAAMLECRPPDTAFVPLNTAALATHRRPGWLACVRGFSRYAWSTEVFPQASNRFGAFQGHGSVEILRNGGQHASGFRRDGWDWRRVPSGTTVLVPLASMLDKGSCLRSRETFAGALTLDGRNGHFAFRMNSEFYGLAARKSVFCFDNEIVCLGSAITCRRQNYPTVTTLFQNGIDAKTDYKPYEVAGCTVIHDAVGNTYVMNACEKLGVSVGHQDSLDQISAQPTQGQFATAWLDHGRRPCEQSYAYTILAQIESRDAIEDIVRNPSVTVLRHDRQVHTVKHHATGITALACFEAGPTGHELLTHLSKPCLAQLRETNGQLELAVCDPDLQWESEACEDVTIVLDGRWTLTGEPLADIDTSDNQTRLIFNGRHGRPLNLQLERCS